MQYLWNEEGVPETSPTVLRERLQLQMISFSLDPQWCGLLFSVYFRHEKPGLLGPDAFATCSLSGPPWDSDWIAFAGSFGFEICRISSTWAVIFDTVKTSGVILLLGVGSLVCYKLYHYYWPRSRSRLGSASSSPHHGTHSDGCVPLRRPDDNQLVEDIDEEDISNIEAQYFGPSPVPSDKLNGNFNAARLFKRSRLSLDQDVSSGLLQYGSLSLPVTPGRLFKNSRRKDLVDRSNDGNYCNPASEFAQCVPQAKFSPSDESGSIITSSLQRDESYDSLGFSKAIHRDGSFDSTCSEMSLDFSLPEATVTTGTMLYLESLQEEIDKLKDNCLMMDEEFETIKCNRNLPGMSSLMKAKKDSTHPSESMNINQNDVQGTLKEEHARACFAGLYSLTTIKNSTSSELSDSFAGNGQGSTGSMESLQWDSPKLEGSPINCTHFEKKHVSEGNLNQSDINPSHLSNLEASLISSPQISCEDDQMASLEWDEDDLLEYPMDPMGVNSVLTSIDIPNTDMETELILKEGLQATRDLVNSGVESAMENMNKKQISKFGSLIERSSDLESSGVECSMTNSATTMASSQFSSIYEHNICPSFSWSSEESGCIDFEGNSVKQSSWLPQAQQGWSDISALAQCSSRSHSSGSSSKCTSEQSTPVGENFSSELISPHLETPVIENIGQKIRITDYASQEWKGNTKKAEVILKGYYEIPFMLGVQHLRRIRGDNYCGVRAAIFQTLAQGLPIPNGAHTFKCLCQALQDEGWSWLQDWNFAGRLPYQTSNVLHGMENCLHSLDTVASSLSSSNDRGELLAAILNSDQLLDLHVVEAVKLHMLISAKELYQASISGADIPLFAMLMFARDTSETPRDLMNNHLRDVGNSGGLEQVEMFLLGYALGVSLKVVRPSAFGTDDFVSFYPDWKDGCQPQVLLVAEDDRHYNILVD